MKKDRPNSNENIFSKAPYKPYEKIVEWVFFGLASICVLSVICIIILMVVTGGPAILEVGITKFLFGTDWSPVSDPPSFGILYLILGSVISTVGAVAIGVPVGILVAVCISKLAPKRLAAIIRPAIDLLAGIPSVIYGFIGLVVLVPFIQNVFRVPSGFTLMAAILVLAVMVLPTIISVAETSIRAVPQAYMEASLALGISKEYTIFKVLIPAAKSGIMAGVLLGVGRALGEAMAVKMVAGNIVRLPEILQPVRLLTTGIVVEMGYSTGLHREILFGIGLVLFVFIMIINGIFRRLIKKAVNQNEKKSK